LPAATAETSAVIETFVVSCISFPQQNPHLERGNYYADKLLFSNCLRTPIIDTTTWGPGNNFTNVVKTS